MLPHPLYSRILAPAVFFFFPRVKELLSGLKINTKKFRTTWDRVAAAVGADEYSAAFRRWFERSQKYINIGGG